MIVINPNRRTLLDSGGVCLVRAKFRALANSLRGAEVVLYQSGRNGRGATVVPGYFATATIEAVYDHATDPKLSVVRLSSPAYWKAFSPLRADATSQESGLVDANGRFIGWRAAEDIRVISASDFAAISRVGAAARGNGLEEENNGLKEAELKIPVFRTRSERVRDPAFSELMYRAYGGQCAVSGVTLLSPGGQTCGLEAAHLYPFALEPRNTVNSGMLLAPSWHARYDSGAIVINDDYSWTAMIEDTDTFAISERRIRLPLLGDEWPDLGLIGRNRERLALG